MNRKIKVNLIIIIICSVILILGISYAFFQYYKAGDEHHQLVTGEVYLKFDDGENTLSLTNIFE